jgi:hypothetical protein
VVWVREGERKSEGVGGSNKWRGKERKREGEERKEEAAAGQRTKTGSTGFAAVWTVKHAENDVDCAENLPHWQHSLRNWRHRLRG